MREVFNPWEVLSLSWGASVDELIEALEVFLMEGGPQVQVVGREALDALRRDPGLALVWRLTSLRSASLHPWDQALEGFGQLEEGSEEVLEGRDVSGDPWGVSALRQAVMRDLLELPELPRERLLEEGLSLLKSEKKEGGE